MRIGLVEEVVEKGAALDAALAMAARVSALSPQAVASSKRLIHQARQGVPRGAALAVERECFVDLFDGADQREGVNAFLEKCAPVWQAS
jgi:enoyl-CoA hydratase/carnithine racemase